MNLPFSIIAKIKVTDLPVQFLATIATVSSSTPLGAQSVAATIDAESGYLDAIAANPRYGAARIVIDGIEIPEEELQGTVKITRSIDQNPIVTAEFGVIGDIWGIPA